MINLLNRLNEHVKKWALAAIIMTIVAYLAAKWYLGSEEVTLLGSLCTIIFGAAAYEWTIKSLKSGTKVPSNEI